MQKIVIIVLDFYTAHEKKAMLEAIEIEKN